MNQHTKRAGTVICAVLLLAILYVYARGYSKTVTSIKSHYGKDDRSLSVGSREIRHRKKSPIFKSSLLPPSVIERVKTFVFFLGHGRSGHSIVGSLLDSHPHIVISHEYGLFLQLSRGTVAPTKPEIFNALWNKSVQSISKGGVRNNGHKGYTLQVDGLYAGSYRDHIDVIGDKKGYQTTSMLIESPKKWSHTYKTLKSLDVSLKVIHVMRNPYDNIATAALYKLPEGIADLKESNETFKIDPVRIDNIIKMYFSLHNAIEEAEKEYNLDIIDVHGQDLILDSKGTLVRICDSLGVSCSDEYLETCSNKIYKTESKTRCRIEWTDDQLKRIQEKINKYDKLRRYSFDS